MGNFININVSVESETDTGYAAALKKKVQKNSSNSPNKKILKSLNTPSTDSDSKLDSRLGKAAYINQTSRAFLDVAKNLSTVTANKAISNYKFSNVAGGNSALANAANNKLTAIQEGIQSVSNTANWAATGLSIGSGFGPLGMAIGTVAGLVIGIGEEVYQQVSDNRAEIAELKWEIQQQMLEADRKARRLGIITTNRGRNSFDYKL